MVRKLLAATAIAGVLSASPAVALAEEGAQSPPTTIEVETSTVEREVTVTTLDVKEVDTDDDDSDKTGLWGLLGLLGLLGLAGLAGRKKHDDATYTSGTVRGDTTARGSTAPHD